MTRPLYTIIYTLLMPIILLRLLWRSRLAPAYRQRWNERFGCFTPPDFDHKKTTIWLHAVSVGEMLAAVPLIKKLQHDHPEWQWVVTTTTPTGSERVHAGFSGSVFHVYAPYDLPFFLQRFLQRVKPTLLIVMETELWPSMIHSCYQHNIPVLIANARLSEKSARGYRKFSALTHAMLNNITCVAAQQQTDGERFVQLGLPRERLTVTGSIKFDVTIDTDTKQKAATLRQQWSINHTRKIWLAASTHFGEDAVILDAFSQLKKYFPDLLLVLVPRHPERFDSVTRQCTDSGFCTLRRSANTAPTQDTDIVIGDSMGELLVFYGAADIAFVGGSLVPVGGHNLIEPAAWGCPIISGPHLFNFSEVEKLLQDNHALSICSDATSLSHTVQDWLTDVEKRNGFGQRAKAVVESNRGALKTLCQLITEHI